MIRFLIIFRSMSTLETNSLHACIRKQTFANIHDYVVGPIQKSLPYGNFMVWFQNGMNLIFNEVTWMPLS